MPDSPQATETAQPVLTAEQVESMIRGGLPSASNLSVVEIASGLARIRMQVDAQMQRPGGTVAGPALFGAADAAMYAVILAHVGGELLAVTTDATIHFLRKPTLHDVLAEARLVKLGRRLAVCSVTLFSAGADEARQASEASRAAGSVDWSTLVPVAVVTGTYSLPPQPLHTSDARAAGGTV